MPKVTVVCRYCGATREVRASYAGRYATCGAVECVHQRRVEGGSKPKGRGAANPRYRDGRWMKTDGVCAVCGAAFVGFAKRKFCSLTCAAADKAAKQADQQFTEERKAKMSASRLGRLKSEAWKARASERFRKAANPNWKGGVTPANQAGRTTWTYKQWRKAVFDRDGHICRVCGTSDSLIAHHLVSYTDFPALRTVLSNGTALCRSCHKSYHLGLVALPEQIG